MQVSWKLFLLVSITGVLAVPLPFERTRALDARTIPGTSTLNERASYLDLDTRSPFSWADIQRHILDDDRHLGDGLNENAVEHYKWNRELDASLYERIESQITPRFHWMNIHRHELDDEDYPSDAVATEGHTQNIMGHYKWDRALDDAELDVRDPFTFADDPSRHSFDADTHPTGIKQSIVGHFKFGRELAEDVEIGRREPWNHHYNVGVEVKDYNL